MGRAPAGFAIVARIPGRQRYVQSHPFREGFHVIPWRWAIERTCAWLLNDHRHSRDYERLAVNSTAMIQVSMIRLLLKRLA